MSANEHDDDQPDMMDVIERLRAENARLRALPVLFENIKWKSVDNDNMEFEGRVTCYQLDAARAAMRDRP